MSTHDINTALDRVDQTCDWLDDHRNRTAVAAGLSAVAQAIKALALVMMKEGS